MKHELADLPYLASALEPLLDERTMLLHHDKHHATYVNKLNEALDAADLQDANLVDLLSDLSKVPQAQRQAVRNHGGGHLNHAMFWRSLSADPDLMGGELHCAVDEAFGTTDKLNEALRAEGAAIFGSGWVWLALKDDQLVIMKTQNQDNPLMHGALPLLGIDVWEHTYYLNYQNRRPDYLAAILRVVNWSCVSERYEKFQADGKDALLDELAL